MSSSNAPQLDPAQNDDCPAVAAWLEHEFKPIPALEPFVLRIATESLDEGLRGQAWLAAGAIAHTQGNGEAAEERYRRGLAIAFGSETKTERSACLNYALICVNEGRVFETLALAARARDLAARHGAWEQLALAHAYAARALAELDEWEASERELTLAEELLPRLSGRYEAYVGRVLALHRLPFAEHERDAARVVSLCAAVIATLDADDEIGRAHLAVLADCYRLPSDEALAALEHALARFSFPVDLEGPMRVLEVELHAREGRFDAAFAAARVCLESLRRRRRDWVAVPQATCSSLQFRQGRQLLRRLDAIAEHDGAADLYRETLDLVSELTLHNIWDLDAFLRQLPQVKLTDPHYIAALERFRERSLADFALLLDGLAARLDIEATTVPESDSRERQICICAWCHRLRGPDRLWLPLDDFEPPSAMSTITHGMCQECAASVQERLPCNDRRTST